MKTNTEATTGQIAKRLDTSIHRIDYIIETRKIEPVRRLGIIRLFDSETQIRIEHALNEIDSSTSQSNSQQSNDECDNV